MVVPLIMIGVQVIASGMVLVFSDSPSDTSANTIIIDTSPAGDGPSPTTSVVFGVVLAALICWLCSQFDSTTAMRVIDWACICVSHSVQQCGVIVLWVRRLAMRDWALAYVAFLVQAWPFLTMAVLWIGWILVVTLRDVSHKSPVSMVEMGLGLGLLYMMFVLKKLYEDMKTIDEDIRRRSASLQSLQQWRGIVDTNLNAARAQRNAAEDAVAVISPRNAVDDAVDFAADVALEFTTGAVKAVLHFFWG